MVLKAMRSVVRRREGALIIMRIIFSPPRRFAGGGEFI
jgi:hypothetical protein